MNPHELSAAPLLLPEAILRARRAAQASGKPVAEVLEESAGLPPESYVAALAETLGYDPIAMAEMDTLAPAFDLLPYNEALAHGCVLFRTEAGALVLAFGDPFDAALRPWAEARIPRLLQWRLAHGNEVSAYLARHGESMRAMDSVLQEGSREGAQRGRFEELSLKAISEHDSPVVRLVHSTLYDALKAGASDVHLETAATQLVIKYRLDGVLSMVGTSSGLEMAEQVISRIKVMAELDIAERRIPQDGRFKVVAQGREIDFRVSIMPSIFGEDAVLRILDKQSLSDHVNGLSLDALGFDERSASILRRLSAEPYGMLLVTGPTGSGKTTTLYAAITEINHGFDKLITIEDPVEYQLSGVLQIPVNERKGLTFALGLRSILRHDPDKIMVGEIRDPETAQIAIQSALTGHLVFTTVHANNVIDVLGRFLNMGVEAYQFVSALNCVLAQRLVRRICLDCKRPAKITREQLIESALDPAMADSQVFYEGEGCIECGGTGYKGRTSICELMDLSDRIRDLILEKRPTSEIKRAAKDDGMTFLRECAVNLVKNGHTTLREINKVTFVE